MHARACHAVTHAQGAADAARPHARRQAPAAASSSGSIAVPVELPARHQHPFRQRPRSQQGHGWQPPTTAGHLRSTSDQLTSHAAAPTGVRVVAVCCCACCVLWVACRVLRVCVRVRVCVCVCVCRVCVCCVCVACRGWVGAGCKGGLAGFGVGLRAGGWVLCVGGVRVRRARAGGRRGEGGGVRRAERWARWAGVWLWVCGVPHHGARGLHRVWPAHA
jgi:hypothetical protein